MHDKVRKIQYDLTEYLDTGDVVSYAYQSGQLDAYMGFAKRDTSDWLDGLPKAYFMGYEDAEGDLNA